MALSLPLKKAGLPWDKFIGADLFKHYKPEPESLGATSLLGYEPEHVMPVASHPYDLDAAKDSGLRTCWVSRPLGYGEG
jgi:2-haloacid dehalogenase